MRAVEIGEPVLVGRKVRRHPVEDDADAPLVQVIDEVHEVLRRAVAGGRREIARDLIAPGAVERVLHDGQQLHVGEAHLDHVVADGVRELPISQSSGCAPRERAARSRGAARRSTRGHPGRSRGHGRPSTAHRPTRMTGPIPRRRCAVASRSKRRTGPPCRRCSLLVGRLCDTYRSSRRALRGERPPRCRRSRRGRSAGVSRDSNR